MHIVNTISHSIFHIADHISRSVAILLHIVNTISHGILDTYMIFVLFSPRAQFFAQFFSTQKRVNRDKTDFATKQRKSQN